LRLTASYRATCAQRLPPLVTTAMHGAFGAALRAIRLSTYEELFARGPVEPRRGITTHAPAAVVLAPERWAPQGPHLGLEEGERLDVRVTLIGDHAIAQRPIVEDALADAGRRGLGIGIGIERRARPKLHLQSITASRGDQPLPWRAAVVRLVTPARLVVQGHVSAEIGAELLWTSILRRSELLAAVYGGSIAWDRAQLPIEVRRARTHVVRIRRHSARQRARMTWPGVVGEIEVVRRGPIDPGPLMAFAEQVQIGKATTFGFGKIAIEAIPE
jgi:hypothetical protein